MSAKAIRRLIALVLALDVLGLAALGLVLGRARRAAHARDALAREIAADTSYSDTDTETALTLAVGEALRLVTLAHTVTAAEGTVPVALSNAAENPYAVALCLRDMRTGEVYAQTGLIDPGWYLPQASLQRELPAGQYYLAAELTFYTADEGVPVGSGVQQLLLTVP